MDNVELHALSGRYRGLGWPRVVGYVGILCLTPLLIDAAVTANRSFLGWAETGIVLVGLCLPPCWWFAFRSGFVIGSAGVLTRRAIGRGHLIAWNDIDRIEWRRQLRSERLWLIGPNCEVRLPTVQRAPGHFTDSFFGGGKLRGPDGSSLDAMDTLQRALSAARRPTATTASLT